VSTIVVTGAAGFVGRRLVEFLHARGDRVVAIDRQPKPDGNSLPVDWIAADLLRPDAYEHALRGASSVLHLAALTGKAPKDAYFTANVEGTRALLAASERAKVERFVLMSSIAVGFSDRRHYPYAESKILAEEAVQSSPLTTAIVRPTMIFGPGSPIQTSLAKLAKLPLIPVFGNGRTLVQPVDVVDVVKLLAGLARDLSGKSDPIEIGGPEVYSIEELIGRLRAGAARERPARFLHLPLGFIRAVLAFLEKPLLSVLPLSAGQLATFANDGTAKNSPLVDRLVSDRTPCPSPTAGP
jgi:nucleoside-diphosphate-sugar epimerase